jgi:hypothetical protein
MLRCGFGYHPPRTARDRASHPGGGPADAGAAIPLADALQRGGIGVVEVTLRTSAGLEAMRRIASEVPGIVVGAGNVACVGGS